MRILRAISWLAPALLSASPLFARPIVVVTSNTILADLAREVGGDRVEVTALARPGADLHDFEPQASDVRILADADVVVLNGLGLEPWIERLVANSGFHGLKSEACDGVDVIEDPAEGGEADAAAHAHTFDPHAWHDPAAARIYIRNIRDVLSARDPDSADFFALRAAQFIQRLDALDSWARERFGAVPERKRKIITSHDSLAYLGRAFGIEVVSVTGISASAEPSAKRVAAVIDLIRTSKVQAVFIDSADNPELMEQIAADAGVKLGGKLITDSLGTPGSGADTYLGMMRQNLGRILDSLK